MEDFSLRTCSPTVNLEDNISCIYIVEAKRVTPLVKQILIYVCFLREIFDNGLFIPKYDNSSVMTAEMCINHI